MVVAMSIIKDSTEVKNTNETASSFLPLPPIRKNEKPDDGNDDD